jgi:EmrB/QacA subfamily drug resistance transporter
LDGSVVNTVLPVINSSLAGNVATIEWVVTIYLLVLSGLLLSFGRLGDIRGHKTIYVLGFVIFITGSILCGFANSVLLLIIFRGSQALGAAMIQANSPAIITKSFPSSQRGQALGLVATMTYLGLTIGPSFGGWLATQFSWRSVFFINIPIGFIALWLSVQLINIDHTKKIHERFDYLGAFTFTAGLVILLFALNRGHQQGWLSPTIIGSFLLAIVMLGLFLLQETRTTSAMLDLSLFKSKIFSISALTAVLNYICVYSILFLMPFYLISGRGYSPAEAGLLLTAQPIIMAIIAPISGSLSDKIGTRTPVVAGMLTLAFGAFLLSKLDMLSSQPQIILSLGIAGLGIGTFISPNNSALMGSADRNRQGIAAGILATARNMGMALGVGLAGATFTTIIGKNGVNDNPLLFHAIQTSFLITAFVATFGGLFAGVLQGKTRHP